MCAQFIMLLVHVLHIVFERFENIEQLWEQKLVNYENSPSKKHKKQTTWENPANTWLVVAIYSSDKSEMKLERLKSWMILPCLNVKISMCVVPMTLQTLSSGKRASGKQIREDLIPSCNYPEQIGITTDPFCKQVAIAKWQRTVPLCLPDTPIRKHKLFTTLIKSNQFVTAWESALTDNNIPI